VRLNPDVRAAGCGSSRYATPPMERRRFPWHPLRLGCPPRSARNKVERLAALLSTPSIATDQHRWQLTLTSFHLPRTVNDVVRRHRDELDALIPSSWNRHVNIKDAVPARATARAQLLDEVRRLFATIPIA
jgi:hypothetical protein